MTNNLNGLRELLAQKLEKLLSSQFALLVFHLGIDPGRLPSNSQAEKVVALLGMLDNEGEHREKEQRLILWLKKEGILRDQELQALSTTQVVSLPQGAQEKDKGASQEEPPTLLRKGKLLSLELSHIRKFKNLKVEFSTGNSQPLDQAVLIGRNGTCKSTLLRCIALALSHQDDIPAMLSTLPGPLLSRHRDEGSIVVELISDRNKKIKIEILIGRKGDRDVLLHYHRSDGNRGEFFVCGYGMGRTAATEQIKQRRYRTMDSVRTLFDYGASLVESELMLRRLRDFMGQEIYQSAMQGITRVLELPDGAEIELPEGGGVTIYNPRDGARIPLGAWADGFRMTFHWLIDLYGWALQARALTADGDIEGILLVDEIEQHLHPSMQMELLRVLSERLPGMQIIATTHSPLTALGQASVKPQSLFPLHEEGDEVVLRPVTHSLRGYSVEDALTDHRLFDTKAFSNATLEDKEKYKNLIRNQNKTDEEQKELKRLQNTLSPTKDLEKEEYMNKIVEELKFIMESSK